MHLLVLSLIVILAGTLMLAKFTKDQTGKFFTWISWFFIIVGGLLFLGSIGHGIQRMRHHEFHGKPGSPEMMMKHGDHGMPGCCCCAPKCMEGGPACQMEETPDAVKQAFTKMFPTATDMKYEMERDAFEVNFKDKGVEMSADFDKTGKWLETETGITIPDLPKEVSASVAKNFAGYKISEVAKVECDKGICYEMDLKSDKEGYEVQFSPKGDVINKHPLKKEKEEKCCKK